MLNYARFSRIFPSREARSTFSTAVHLQCCTLCFDRPTPFLAGRGTVPFLTRFTTNVPCSIHTKQHFWEAHCSPPISTTLCQSIRNAAIRSAVGSAGKCTQITHGRVVFLVDDDEDGWRQRRNGQTQERDVKRVNRKSRRALDAGMEMHP